MQRHLFVLLATAAAGLIACSGTTEQQSDELPDATNVDVTDSGSSADAGSNNVEADSGTTANNSSEPDMGEPEPQPAPGKAEFCAGLSQEIRDSAGRTIEVAPAGEGRVTVDGQEMTLRQAVSRAEDGDTVVLADGTYTFPPNPDGSAFTGIYITTPNVTLRSASGNPEAVIIDSNYRDHGRGSAPVTIAASGVTVADLTVTRSIYHLVHLWAEGDAATLHNLRLVDGGQQFVKSSASDGTIDDVSVTCSAFLMTDQGRDNVWGYGAQNGNTTCYTGGIDSHEGQGWNITDNSFRGIYCDAEGVQRPAHGRNPDGRGGQTYQGGLAEHAIHMWDSPQGGGGHFIARNHIVDCARGIGLGFVAEVYDIVVRDNMIYSRFPGAREHDVGISAERAHNTQVVHNTVFYSHPDAYSNTLEYRWDSTSNLRVANNLTNGRIRARDGAEATVEGNVTDAEASWFVDHESADLHLAACDIAQVADAAVGSDPEPDFDHEPRGDSPDVGADECL
jgi:hypothetical protein